MLNAFGVVLIVLGAMAALIPVVAGVMLHHLDRKPSVDRPVQSESTEVQKDLVSTGS